ncbi:glycosyltransferase family 2 protein [Actinopolymorpha rutila]|uniref:Cellulose synthase/poly-beta-1,6-N-acetylglucosamine synthase-like glycosyltransferase n=1 Tax=Actinopolymorpha rutila TaxID=446787 RepID=A0A852ZF06_9ACTN|nr:glycosyltransferase family 2 protein [Actinopolymorpha rutila]NYH87550.1 cellulose synthase/poly-beta-1,6-N-acetylglucosamine synthase-like glycosyltransferase [Actinopolymorpha rutila]
MTTVTALLVVLAMVAVPVLAVAVDALASLRARGRVYTFAGTRVNSDFEVLVPIWGSIMYLENADYLAAHGDRVVLCTPSGESDDFYSDLYALARRHGFRVFVASFTAPRTGGRRATSGTVRDRLIRDALNLVRATYVVPLDADTTTVRPLDVLVGELERQGADLASVRLVPLNSDTLLARLQHYEYRLAMRFRFLASWLVSGACHVARTEVLADVMSRHSLFFQGNDVEVGLIARALGYRVAHIPFEVPTTVPGTARGWFRQRLAWAGGEFRLFVVNARFVTRHPWFWVYGGVVTIALAPLRWLAVDDVAEGVTLVSSLTAALVLYAALVAYLHWRHRGPVLLLLPFYMLFVSLVMPLLGVLWYVRMAWQDRNLGIIRPHLVRVAPRAPEPDAGWVRQYI